MKRLIPMYFILILLFLFAVGAVNKAINVWTESTIVTNRKCVVIDAGHGGEDGGAVSHSGVFESNINLQIAIKLNDLMHLLGIETKMIRTTDCSVNTSGNTIAARKSSDLKERVNIINTTDNAVLVSIHQNYFSDQRYQGAQVFYAKTADSKIIAQNLQSDIVHTINPDSHRHEKPVENIYLMQNIQCPGVLVECGFISNPEEEAKLLSEPYQRKICSVIACLFSRYLHGNGMIA